MSILPHWLLGIRSEQPLQYRRLRRIRSRIFTTVVELDAEVLRSAEPVPFAEMVGQRSGEFRPIRRGEVWGRSYGCAWLRVRGEVPVGAEDAELLVATTGEGLAYAPDGTPLDAITTVFQQGDMPDPGGRYRSVRGVDLTGGRVECHIDLGYNGWMLYPLGRGRYRGAKLARRDPSTNALYFDYLTLAVLAGATEDASLAAGIRADLDAAWARFRADDVEGARAALAARLAAPSGQAFTYSAVGHGHLDLAWLWPWRETKRKAARTYTRALNNIAEYPGYVYGTSQPQQLRWMQREQPALFERIRAAVAAGRIELQGAFWVETDTNLPGGESLVRQALVGRRFLVEEFGERGEAVRLCWLPDAFGYSGNLPQLLAKAGMDWFSTIKISWNKVNVFPHRSFHWQGIDGTSVLVHMPPEGDYNSRGAADGILRGIRLYPERALERALLVFGAGDGGGGPGEVHLEVTGREHDLHGLPRVEYSRADDFFLQLEQQEVAHTHRGELYLETHQGTYTTQAAIKRGNRVVERKLHEAEALDAVTGHDGREALRGIWEDVLLGHFHDILPGSSIERVNREQRAVLERVGGELDAAIAARLGELRGTDAGSATGGADAASAVPGGADTTQSSSAAATPGAANLSPVPRSEYLRVDERWFHAELDPYSAGPLTPFTGATGLAHTADELSNGLVRLRFGANGEIVSWLDADGTEQSAGGLNRLTLHRDPYQWPYDAWDIGMRYLRRTPRILRPVEVSTELDGPRLTRLQRFSFGRSSVEQRVSVEAGSPVVRFDTSVDWHETHRMLRADFRPTRFADTVKCEIQFGHIERVTTERDAIERAQFEVCAHKWVAVEDAAGGFAVLNDGKYGHRAKSGLLSLNLLRSPTFPDRNADRGEHRFSYAALGFGAGRLADVVHEGYRLNHPLLRADGVELRSVARAAHPGVLVETVKRAEHGDGVVLRCYESLGRATVTALATTLPHTRVTETDLLERPIGPADLDRLEFGPFEVKTLLLESAS